MAGQEGQAFQCSLWLCRSNLVVTPSGEQWETDSLSPTVK
jgi:hypothetical protein